MTSFSKSYISYSNEQFADSRRVIVVAFSCESSSNSRVFFVRNSRSHFREREVRQSLSHQTPQKSICVKTPANFNLNHITSKSLIIVLIIIVADNYSIFLTIIPLEQSYHPIRLVLLRFNYRRLQSYHTNQLGLHVRQMTQYF